MALAEPAAAPVAALVAVLAEPATAPLRPAAFSGPKLGSVAVEAECGAVNMVDGESQDSEKYIQPVKQAWMDKENLASSIPAGLELLSQPAGEGTSISFADKDNVPTAEVLTTQASYKGADMDCVSVRFYISV